MHNADAQHHLLRAVPAHLSKQFLTGKLQAHILSGRQVHGCKKEWLHCAAFDFSQAELVPAERRRSKTDTMVSTVCRMV